VVNKRLDAFVCLATGSGKSIVYQLPATLSQKHVVLVVSPLVSLMQDQVMKLDQCGISSTFLGSSQTDHTTEDRVLRGEFRIVYVTPEKVEIWGDKLSEIHRQHGISLIAVDEVRSAKGGFGFIASM
jgi:superfamily II DNA helicase RecQ